MSLMSRLKPVARAVLSRRMIGRLLALRSRVKGIRTYYFTFPHTQTRVPGSRLGVSRTNLLEELGAKYQPSKRIHDYLRHYWSHFRDIRLDVKSVLEIGIQTDRSLRMWEDFFPNATIYGIDIDPLCRRFEGGRRRVFIGDQGVPAFLRRVADVAGEFDIVIDDGSHIVEHQLRTFDVLFPSVSVNGSYVIEDVGVGVDPSLRTVNALKRLIDKIMYWPPGFDPPAWPTLSKFPEGTPWAERNIIGISFYRWIVFVMRGRNPESNPFLRAASDSGEDTI